MDIRELSAFTLEEASELTRSKPFLPYRPAVVTKVQGDEPLQPFEPLQAFDNVWWMGSKAVGALVIDTGDGLIMIDSGSNDAEAAHIAQSFGKMGLDVSDVRLIVVGHEHFDHYGGIPYLLKNCCPDAMIAMSRIGWDLLQTVPTEFAFTEPRPDRVDILIDDGLCLSLGNTTLFCISTPGHSAGCISFIFNSALHGDELTVGVMGGSAVWPNFPEARLYENSIEYYKLYTDIFGCNAFSAPHQKESELERVRDHWSKGTPHPWACTKEAFDKTYLQGFRNRVQETIYSGKMQPYIMPGGVPDESPLPPRK